MKSISFNFRSTAVLMTSVLVISLLSSCLVEPLENQGGDNIGSITELKAGSSFDWKTTNSVEVTVMGLPVEVGVKRRLTLMAEEGSAFYAGSMAMNDDFKMEFELPNHTQGIIMEYGEIRKTGEISGGKVNFDFIVSMGTEDIDD